MGIQEGEGGKPSIKELEEALKNFGLHLDYEEYLEQFKNRPPLTGCTGPMSFGEWKDSHETLESLKNLSKTKDAPLSDKD